MPTATLTSKGQVTIPKAIRDRLGLNAGDTVVFTVDETGRLVVRAGTGCDSAVGALRDFAPARPISVRAMKDAVRRRARAGALPGAR